MSGLYKLFVVLHLLTVIGGIGTVVLNGLYANIAQKRGGAEGLAVSEANFDVSNVAEKLIYLIPVFGIAAVLASDDAWEFDQKWIWISLVLYVVALGISHAVMIPGHRRINELARTLGSGSGGKAEADEMQAVGKRLGAGGATLDLIVVVIVVLMVWKPL